VQHGDSGGGKGKHPKKKKVGDSKRGRLVAKRSLSAGGPGGQNPLPCQKGPLFEGGKGGGVAGRDGGKKRPKAASALGRKVLRSNSTDLSHRDEEKLQL